MITILLLVFIFCNENCLVEGIRRGGQRRIHAVPDNTVQQRLNGSWALNRRQELPLDNTCGFYGGDASRPRTADPGFACRVDTKNGIWGFCPTTVIAATDCGLAGACFDSNNCVGGCGISDESSITTISCTETSKSFCSFAVLTAGPDQVYSYIACGGRALTDNLLAAATTTSLRVVTSVVTPTPIPTSSLPKSSSVVSLTTETRTPKASSRLPSSLSQTSAPTSTPVPQSSPSSSASDVTAPNTGELSSPAPNNVKVIVGGVIGGITLICLTVLGIICMRKYRRDPRRQIS